MGVCVSVSESELVVASFVDSAVLCLCVKTDVLFFFITYRAIIVPLDPCTT